MLHDMALSVFDSFSQVFFSFFLLQCKLNSYVVSKGILATGGEVERACNAKKHKQATVNQ